LQQWRALRDAWSVVNTFFHSLPPPQEAPLPDVAIHLNMVLVGKELIDLSGPEEINAALQRSACVRDLAPIRLESLLFEFLGFPSVEEWTGPGCSPFGRHTFGRKKDNIDCLIGIAHKKNKWMLFYPNDTDLEEMMDGDYEYTPLDFEITEDDDFCLAVNSITTYTPDDVYRADRIEPAESDDDSLDEESASNETEDREERALNQSSAGHIPSNNDDIEDMDEADQDEDVEEDLVLCLRWHMCFIRDRTIITDHIAPVVHTIDGETSTMHATWIYQAELRNLESLILSVLAKLVQRSRRLPTYREHAKFDKNKQQIQESLHALPYYLDEDIVPI
jgi:hypothetical protein